jgi:hypothetical protein
MTPAGGHNIPLTSPGARQTITGHRMREYLRHRRAEAAVTRPFAVEGIDTTWDTEEIDVGGFGIRAQQSHY